MIVNTATGCGFTPQYKGLEELYKKYHDKGLEILDFPCDQFWHQAPWNDDEIHQFCTMKYNTTFDQFSKIEVNGENADPLFKWLCSQNNEGKIKKVKWNFTKFLINRNGEFAGRFEPTAKPKSFEDRIKQELSN